MGGGADRGARAEARPRSREMAAPGRPEPLSKQKNTPERRRLCAKSYWQSYSGMDSGIFFCFWADKQAEKRKYERQLRLDGARVMVS
ncbi:hypothetical protein NDU88_001647 [Pleurodeles waltl]|uniref:Uncharacterized protein n=1 Tax=Pleurodeles waltl TaxID=8319 RepID=A0AAV7KQU4_PLEWA|nr:hypothetical protein NDU88_001647 [Pleurodeles waltl]